MRISVPRPAIAAAAITIAAGAIAGMLALRPAVASDSSMIFHVGPFALVKCALAAPGACQQYKNTSNGVGVEGDAYKGTGVKGTSYTIAGISVDGIANKGIGVEGTTVYGQAGVEGISSTSSGVLGSSQSAIGVYGTSNTGTGVLADGSGSATMFVDNFANGNAIEAHGAGSGASYYAFPYGGGPAGYFDATNSNGYGTITYSSGAPAVWAHNSNGNGADISGSYIGVIARGSSYPFDGLDNSGNTLFYVDSGGNVYAHGGYFNFLRTRGGGGATGYASVSAAPTVDDNGTAQLVNGVAIVRLDPTFARTIDASRPYQVMLTPDGDTRGLYVASKSLQGFVVREVQGGHSSISFDYHIYAPTLGNANTRMMMANPTGAGSPKAPMLHPRQITPTLSPIHH